MDTFNAFKKVLATSLLIALPILANAAGDGSGGAGPGGSDYLPSYPNANYAWFSHADRTVRYCVERDANFGASEAEVEASIQFAIAQWTNLVTKGSLLGSFEDRAHLALHFRKESCSPSTDLSFYFGVENQNVAEAKKKYNAPVGISAQTNLENDSSWTTGFIYLAPDNAINAGHPNWKMKYELNAILLHEIGHVFGANHTEGTIMTSRLAFYIEYPRLVLENKTYATAEGIKSLEKYYSKINQQMIIDPDDSSFDSEGNLGNGEDFMAYYSAPTRTPEKVFQQLTGRKSQGKISARFIYAGYMVRDYSAERFAILEVSDSVGKYDLKIKIISDTPDQNPNVSEYGGLCFNQGAEYRQNPDFYIMSMCSGVRSSETFGSLKTQTGKNLEVVIQINFNFRMADGPIRVNLITPKGIETLFRAKLY